ncbi:MAG TPA: hypothetical protein PKA10_15340 [Selenomonadales bacterium]|nr:hypothetical protein [Selenomonadales bacterium]
MDMSGNLKSTIMYHRSYRKLPGSLPLFLLQFVGCAVPISAATIFFYPQITRAVCIAAKTVLESAYFPGRISIVEIDYIHRIGNVSFLDLPSQFPTPFFSLMNALACLVLLIVLPRIERVKPVMIFFTLLAFIHLISSLFFIAVASRFPYEAVDSSRLYMLQQISIWFFVPIVMGLAVMPLPSSLTAKGSTMIITYVYSLIFGTVRYMVFLFILTKASLLYMAILFFALGPLIDFVYIVGIYSAHVTWLAKKVKDDYTLWKWQY